MRIACISLGLLISVGCAGAWANEPRTEVQSALPTQEQLWPPSPPPPLRLTAIDASTGAPVSGALARLCQRRPDQSPLATAGVDSNACHQGFMGKDGKLIFKDFDQGLFDLRVDLDGFASAAVLGLRFGEDPHSPAEITVILNPICYHCYASDIAETPGYTHRP